MSGSGGGLESPLMQTRDQMRSDGEPILELTRTLQSYGNGSIHCNVPSEARDILQLAAGDEVAVDVHRDRIVIRPPVAADGGGE